MKMLAIFHLRRQIGSFVTFYEIVYEIQSDRLKLRHASHDELKWLCKAPSSLNACVRIVRNVYLIHQNDCNTCLNMCIRATWEDIDSTAEINICHSMLEMFWDKNWRWEWLYRPIHVVAVHGNELSLHQTSKKGWKRSPTTIRND